MKLYVLTRRGVSIRNILGVYTDLEIGKKSAIKMALSEPDYYHYFHLAEYESDVTLTGEFMDKDKRYFVPDKTKVVVFLCTKTWKIDYSVSLSTQPM